MKRTALVLAVIAATVAAPAALSKGPSEAAVSGPGLDGTITISGFGEPGSPTPLGTLVDSGGFFPAVFARTPDPMLASSPADTLGPRYTVRYTLPGPTERPATIVQQLYPYATPAPVTYTAPGQPYWKGQRSHGGWYQGSAALKRALVGAGLPAKAPGTDSGWPPTLIGSIAAAALLAAALTAGVIRRVRRHGGAAGLAPTRTP